jgi:hypothetical protein
MKRPATRIKELRLDLAYWQERARMDARCLCSSIEKVKEIAAKMRAVQKENK